MKWLKDKLFRYKLKAKLRSLPAAKKETQQNSVNFIGLLFDENHIPLGKELQYYIDRWTSNGKKVDVFSFVDVKEFDESVDDSKKFCRKNVNWFQVPHGDKIDGFLQKPFDILITLNPAKKQHLHFLNAASNARFKIGLLPDELEFYNLILDVEETASIKNIFSDIQETLDKLTI